MWGSLHYRQRRFEMVFIIFSIDLNVWVGVVSRHSGPLPSGPVLNVKITIWFVFCPSSFHEIIEVSRGRTL